MNPSHLPKKQIGWVHCGITYEGILVPGSTGDPANMAAQGGCSQYIKYIQNRITKPKTESQNSKQNHKTQNRITKPKTESQNSKQKHKTQNRNTKLKTETQNQKRKHSEQNHKGKKGT